MDYGAALGAGSSFTTGFTGLNKLLSIQQSEREQKSKKSAEGVD
jgi:hypothetical protein